MIGSHHAIQRLAPPMTGWHILVKVLRLFRVDYPFRTLGLVLSNEAGTRIEAIVDQTLADYYFEEIEEGKWYTVTKFVLRPNDTKFRVPTHPFKIYFLDDTVVTRARHVPVSSIRNHFARFQSIIDGSIDSTYLVELVGAIVYVGWLENTSSDVLDVDGFRISFKLKDKDERVLDCMALKQQALDFERTYRIHGSDIITVVLRWWKVYRFRDGPTNVKICSNGSISKVYTNEIIPEVQEINDMVARTKDDGIVVDL